MVGLGDLVLLPEARELLERLIADGPGLVVVAGLDVGLVGGEGTGAGSGAALPSGRSAIFHLLMGQMLAAQAGKTAVVVAETGRDGVGGIRVPRGQRRRVEALEVGAGTAYAGVLATAAGRRPGLLVVDRLGAENVPAVLEAAHGGIRVLSQLDTVLRGAEVTEQLLELGARRQQLGGLRWVVAVERRATLCTYCREHVRPISEELDALARMDPALVEWAEERTFWRAPGCARCGMSGRSGEITAFDLCQCGAGGGTEAADDLTALPMVEYLLGLAAEGYLPLSDALGLNQERLQRLSGLLSASERSRIEMSRALAQRQAELEAANRVLQQRTDALIALEQIGEALIRSRDLVELADQLCRKGSELLGADRVLLYYNRRTEPPVAEIVAACGWDPSLVHQTVEASLLYGDKQDPDQLDRGREPQPFNHWPPGVPRRPSDVTADALRAGLRVPLVVEKEPVGLMIVYTSQKKHFTPGDVALLQTFANQAAVAIQRAGLVEALQEKISQLEAAQAELVQKERMEREMELARQVQQSVLPQVFPLVPGYRFAAYNRPARQVGGDFYDVIPLDAGHFGLVIGDVSDKGMPAALYMALTHSLLRAEIRRGSRSPRDTLVQVHRLLQELGRSRMFVTALHGVIDGPSRRLTYARAGHDRPILLRGGGVEALSGEGTVLGFPQLEELHLTEEQIDLLPGDRLVLYTDGLTDLMSPDGQRFGRQRFIALLQTHAERPYEVLCEVLFADLAAFQGEAEQFDDMTVLVVEVQ